MQKRQCNVGLDDETLSKLTTIAEHYGTAVTPNSILAMAAVQIARVRPENLFHALGRIPDGDSVEIVAASAAALPRSRKRAQREIPVSRT